MFVIVTRSFLLAILVHSYLNPSIAWASETVTCSRGLYPIGHIADCNAALNLIPAGYNIDRNRFHPNEPKPITLHLSAHDRQRKPLLPAAFNAGSCLITVESTTEPSDVRQPRDAAMAMSLTMWPNVKRLAQKIVSRCCQTVSGGACVEGGEVAGESILEGGRLTYKINVQGKPRFWEVTTREGRGRMRVYPWHAGDPLYNLYETDGAGHQAAVA